jgi:hypothetical protein
MGECYTLLLLLCVCLLKSICEMACVGVLHDMSNVVKNVDDIVKFTYYCLLTLHYVAYFLVLRMHTLVLHKNNEMCVGPLYVKYNARDASRAHVRKVRKVQRSYVGW